MHARTSSLRITLLALLLGAALAGPARAQYLQQGGKLSGPDAVGNAFQGLPVSLSADGNTALWGGFGDNALGGAAWVYTRSFGAWSPQGAKLFGSGAVGNARQGSSVRLSADGNTAVVGGPFDAANVGAAWVFVRSGGTWSQQGGKLVGSGAVGNARQGTSVAISGDGNTILVGGLVDNAQAGAAWVFTRSGNAWSQQGTKLVGSGSTGNAQQGISVALSFDGNTAAVGGSRDNTDAGAVWVFTRSGNTWSQQGGKLVASGAVGAARQGYQVALSNDGNTLLVGARADNGNAGAAWVFTRTGSSWTQQGGKLVGSDAVGNASQGIAIALSPEGDRAAVGGPEDEAHTGATWIFTRAGNSWSQLGQKIVGTGATGSAAQGSSLALSSNGGTLLVGASDDNALAGAAWVFVAPAAGVSPATAIGHAPLALRIPQPNPVRGASRFHFALGRPGSVSLRIHDVAGREVRSLVEGELPAGEHSTVLHPHGLPGGLYFARLRQGEDAVTKRFVIQP